PEEIGQWTYKASFVQGVDIAMKQNSTAVDTIPLDNPYGSFEVVPTQKKGQELKALGRLIADEGRFKFVNSEQYFLKVGANSPENFLAYKGFDNTYRIKASSREGEAKSNSTIHQYKPHFTFKTCYYCLEGEISKEDSQRFYVYKNGPALLFRYDLKRQQSINLSIINASGKTLKNLIVNDLKKSGNNEISWDGTSDSGKQLPAGVYIAILESNEGTLTRKFILDQ
ncbi:MAG: FlgD immunoglobulin-like domain containing protein, partial [Bacteroidota bacterium]